MRLEDPARQCAIILITREHDTDLLKLNPTRLAKLLAGNASVVAATSTGVDRELEYILPRGFSCWNGAVRVYQPRLRFGVEADSRRHRYFLREQIDGLTADAVEAMIVRGIARSSRTRTTFGVGSVEDVVVRQRELRLQELRQNTPDTSLQEKLKTYDDLIGLVDEENKALSSQLATLKQELEDAEAERAEIETNIPTLQYERDHLRRENMSLEARVRSLNQQRELVQGLQKLPESLLDVIELIAGIWSGRIVFTDRAKLSAKRASLNKAYGEIPKAWGCVWAMATVLHGLLFSEEQDKGNVPERFRAATGFELTFTEGKQTKQDKKFMRLRRDVFNGSEIDITPHVKYGSTPPRCLRVHFCPLHDKKIIVVGHCGDHLDTYGTQWL